MKAYFNFHFIIENHLFLGIFELINMWISLLNLQNRSDILSLILFKSNAKSLPSSLPKLKAFGLEVQAFYFKCSSWQFAIKLCTLG